MPLIINNPELEAQLAVAAKARGLSVDAYIESVLISSTEENCHNDGEQARRKRREQAAAEIRELRNEITLGPNLTIRTLIDEGRRF